MSRVPRLVEDWTIDRLEKLRPSLSFPEYQRQPNLWPTEKKNLLIDSVLLDLDIPKLYFNKVDDTYEVVDGQQRLWAIWHYLEDAFAYKGDGDGKRYSQLNDEQRRLIRNYAFQVTVFDDANEHYLRELFIRLQLGLLLITGEKLNAATGKMRDFVFKRMVGHPFIQAVNIPSRRFAKETLCAQICINSFALANIGEFARTRYDDLHFFFKSYQEPRGADLVFFSSQTKKILQTLDQLGEAFGPKAAQLRNRSFALSIFLFFERHSQDLLVSVSSRGKFVRFSEMLWARLKAEAKKGIDRQNRELYSFETLISSAPGERYQIERRDQKLEEYFAQFLTSGALAGDSI